jgi:small subunit ribosomal protein S17
MTADTAKQQIGTALRRRATRTGVVISDRMDKTIIVAVERRVSHAKYFRVVTRTSKFYAHDEHNACKAGDVVTIVETRPMSRLKRWRVRTAVRAGQPVTLGTAAAASVPSAKAAKAAAKTRRRAARPTKETK